MVKNDVVILLSGCYPRTWPWMVIMNTSCLVFRLFFIREENDDTYERERKVKNPFYSNSLWIKQCWLNSRFKVSTACRRKTSDTNNRSGSFINGHTVFYFYNCYQRRIVIAIRCYLPKVRTGKHQFTALICRHG